MVQEYRKGDKVKTPGGIGYIEAQAENESHLILYRSKERDAGLVLYEFGGSCMFKIESDDEIEMAE